MTAKVKAKEIAMRFDKEGETDNAKQCALICVEEILEIKSVYHSIELDNYWQEVKQEINKL